MDVPGLHPSTLPFPTFYTTLQWCTGYFVVMEILFRKIIIVIKFYCLGQSHTCTFIHSITVHHCIYQSVFYSIAFIGVNIVVTERCVIGTNCSLLSKETLPPGTVITGKDHLRWTRQATTQVCKIEFYTCI